MKRQISIEFWKLMKADNILFVFLLFLYPVMWSVLAYRNEVVLVENGHSILSWILVQLFAMDKTFILLCVFGLVINEIVRKEKNTGYFGMIQMSGNCDAAIYVAKAIASILFCLLLFMGVVIGTAVCYIVFVRNNTVMATGKLWNDGELVPGIGLILIWVLDKCVLIPILFVNLYRKFSMAKTVAVLIGLSFFDRLLAMLPITGFLSIWNNYKNAEHFISLCREQGFCIHINIYIQIIMYVFIAIGCIYKLAGKEQRLWKE